MQLNAISLMNLHTKSKENLLIGAKKCYEFYDAICKKTNNCVNFTKKKCYEHRSKILLISISCTVGFLIDAWHINKMEEKCAQESIPNYDNLVKQVENKCKWLSKHDFYLQTLNSNSTNTRYYYKINWPKFYKMYSPSKHIVEKLIKLNDLTKNSILISILSFWFSVYFDLIVDTHTQMLEIKKEKFNLTADKDKNYEKRHEDPNMREPD